ncbi:MAG: ubiquinol-cytochrome c reductase iron-sulfur subunit [Gemmatimonadales bacterium]
MDPERSSRRRFLIRVAGALAAIEGMILAVPLVGTAIGPSFRKLRLTAFAKVGPVATLPVGQPTEVTFNDVTADAYLSNDAMRHAWAVAKPGGTVTVFSPICPHLGCRYDWDAADHRFACPCHGSQFALDGTVLAGPAPRPLDPLPSEIRDGTLFVRWELFKSGIPTREEV